MIEDGMVLGEDVSLSISISISVQDYIKVRDILKRCRVSPLAYLILVSVVPLVIQESRTIEILQTDRMLVNNHISAIFEPVLGATTSRQVFYL